jgi:hypothetical protein
MSRILLTLVCLGLAMPLRADRLVLCAPGYPGTTEEAQPTMDAFAAAVLESAEDPTGSLEAVYTNDESRCGELLSEPSTILALVTAPYLFKHREGQGLRPVGRVLPAGAGETASPDPWSLVAKKGAIQGPQDLDGWAIAGTASYAPGYVREALGSWGTLPSSTSFQFQPRVLSALRKAARGEPVAVLLDGPQANALPGLPFAADLEVVFVSPPLDVKWVVAVGDAPEPTELRQTLLEGLFRIHTRDAASEVLQTMEISRILPPEQR